MVMTRGSEPYLIFVKPNTVKVKPLILTYVIQTWLENRLHLVTTYAYCFNSSYAV